MKGICFKEHLFHATVAGTKTQTRRIIKPTKVVAEAMPESLFKEDGTIGCVFYSNGFDIRTAKPRYNEGEIVYLKESYVDDCLQGSIAYKYNEKDVEYLKNAGFEEDMKIPGFWKNKLFMPESVARHFIKITGTRIERLQDISDEDCIKEGIVIEETFQNSNKYNTYCNGVHSFDTPKKAYQALINQINGSSTWNDNPFVWVYDYELIKK